LLSLLLSLLLNLLRHTGCGARVWLRQLLLCVT
jgi:hypothetical protein